MKTPPWLVKIARPVNQNSTTILSAAAVGGVVATAYLAARAAVKAQRELDKMENVDADSPREKLEITWQFFVPPVLSGAATIACIIGSNHIGLRRQAAYLGAYTLADAAFREYKDEVLEQLGRNKAEKIDDEIARKHIEANPVQDHQVIITSGGDSLCFDLLTGRYFKSDAESIRRAANDCNAHIFSDMYISLNEFYALLGLADCDLGDQLGFNIENNLEVRFSSHLSQDNKPCLAVGFERLPRPDYTKF